MKTQSMLTLGKAIEGSVCSVFDRRYPELLTTALKSVHTGHRSKKKRMLE